MTPRRSLTAFTRVAYLDKKGAIYWSFNLEKHFQRKHAGKTLDAEHRALFEVLEEERTRTLEKGNAFRGA